MFYTPKKDTSIKIPKVLAERFEKIRTEDVAWESYRSFSEFCLSNIRNAVSNYEAVINERKEEIEIKGYFTSIKHG